MPRLFIAVDFPAAVNRRLKALCSGLAGARWLPPSRDGEREPAQSAKSDQFQTLVAFFAGSGDTVSS